MTDNISGIGVLELISIRFYYIITVGEKNYIASTTSYLQILLSKGCFTHEI